MGCYRHPAEWQPLGIELKWYLLVWSKNWETYYWHMETGSLAVVAVESLFAVACAEGC
jgi:ABC-type spermidine/putrescine transport system permease subunit II